MQEQINEKTIALTTKTTQLTANEFRKLIILYMRYKKQKKLAKKSIQIKPVGKKTTLEKLTKKYDGLKSIEITDKNIKGFEKIAKKYNVEYALKKDIKTVPPTYFVFFKGKDLDIIDHAFKEYLKKSLEKVKDKRPSLKKTLKKMIEMSKKLNKSKIKNKDKEQSL
jgi:hypothetical protein